LTGSSEEFGAIGAAAISEEALDLNAVGGVKAKGLVKSKEDAGDFFIWQKTSESEAAVVINGDMEGLDPGARIAVSAIAGGTDAGAGEAAQLLDVEVKELAGMGAFVTNHGRFGRFQGRESIKMMAAQDAREGGLGDGQNHEDLSVGTALPAEGEDLGFELGAGLAGLAEGDGGVIFEALRKAGCFGARQPAANGLFADPEGEGGVAQGEAKLVVTERHLCSRQRGEFGISVHVVRAVWRWVECSSTTSLPNASRADNVLKHDI
jgi:hypothetical protein